MKNFLLCALILSLVLIAGCSQQAEAPLNSEDVVSPSPTIDNTEPPVATSAKPRKEDAINPDGSLNADAVNANIGSFTVNELIEFFPKSDGCLTSSILDELSKRLQNDFNGVISSITNADLSNDMRDELAWHIGAEFQIREISDAESEILYSADGLTEQEQKVLNKIIEGFEAEI